MLVDKNQSEARSTSMSPIADSADGIMAAIRTILLTLQLILARLDRTSKPLYTVDEVADLTGRSAFTVRRWISQNRITATRVMGTGPRGRLLIGREELSKLIEGGLGGEIPTDGAGAQ